MGGSDQAQFQQKKTRSFIEVELKDLPLSCPMKNKAVWNEHPRVYLPIKKVGKARCYYCGKEYILKK